MTTLTTQPRADWIRGARWLAITGTAWRVVRGTAWPPVTIPASQKSSGNGSLSTRGHGG